MYTITNSLKMAFLTNSFGYNFLSTNPYNNFPSVMTPMTCVDFNIIFLQFILFKINTYMLYI